MKFTDILFKENKEVWEGYLEHPFLKEMADGTLNLESFKYYMIKDYLYLFEYLKVFSIGISKVNYGKNSLEAIEIVDKLSGSLTAINWEVDNTHKKYMKRIGITEEDIKSAKSSLTNIGYTSYMLAKANEGDVINTIIAVLSCSWSYAYIAKNLSEKYPKMLENNFFGEWVKSYQDKVYQEENQKFMELVDRLCANLEDSRKEELKEIFHICSIFEMKFWDMAYTRGKSDEMGNYQC